MWKKPIINFAIFFMIIFNIFLWGYLFDKTGFLDKVASTFSEEKSPLEEKSAEQPKDSDHVDSSDAGKEQNTSDEARGEVNSDAKDSSSSFDVIDIK